LKKKPTTDHRSDFAEKFAEYVKDVEKTDAKRAAMLKALSEFLTGEGIDMNTLRHFEVLAKMMDFAGPVRGGNAPGG
jgi:hypothetical protein